MTSEIENTFAVLITEFGRLEVDLENLGRARERLTTLKQIIEAFHKQTISKAIIEDIAQHSKTDDALQESRQLLESIVEKTRSSGR